MILQEVKRAYAYSRTAAVTNPLTTGAHPLAATLTPARPHSVPELSIYGNTDLQKSRHCYKTTHLNTELHG